MRSSYFDDLWMTVQYNSSEPTFNFSVKSTMIIGLSCINIITITNNLLVNYFS